jgi:hypothetical protein
MFSIIAMGDILRGLRWRGLQGFERVGNEDLNVDEVRARFLDQFAEFPVNGGLVHMVVAKPSGRGFIAVQLWVEVEAAEAGPLRRAVGGAGGDRGHH